MNQDLAGTPTSYLAELLGHPRFVPFCLVLALVLRVGWVICFVPAPFSDSRWYLDRGFDLANGLGYSVGPDSYWPPNFPTPPPSELGGHAFPHRRPTAFWPIGYPAFLGLLFALFGHSPAVSNLANIGLSLGVGALAYSLALALLWPPVVARLTLLILTLNPEQIAYTSLHSAELLFLFLFLLGVRLLLLPDRGHVTSLLAGFTLGCATLVKTQALPLAALFFICRTLACRQKPLRGLVLPAVIAHLALILTISPWLIRNYVVFGTLTLANNGGYNLLIGNNPDATGGYRLTAPIQAALSTIPDEHKRDEAAKKEGLRYMHEHPIQVLALIPRKLAYLYGKDVLALDLNQGGISMKVRHLHIILLFMKIVSQLMYLTIATAFLAFVFAGVRSGARKFLKATSMIGLIFILYFTAVSLLAFGNARFHFSLMPWFIMYAAAFVANSIGPRGPAGKSSRRSFPARDLPSENWTLFSMRHSVHLSELLSIARVFGLEPNKIRWTR